MPDIIKFPLPKKPLKKKHKSITMTPDHIVYTVKSALEDGLSLQHVPVILSYTYTGVLTIKDVNDTILLTVEDGDYSFAYILKKSMFKGITTL